MSAKAPPLRFLIIVVGGWTCARLAVLAPYWGLEQGSAEPRERSRIAAAPVAQAAARAESEEPYVAPGLLPFSGAAKSVRFGSLAARNAPPFTALPFVAVAEAARVRPPLVTVPVASLPSAPVALTPPLGASRWSASAWLFVRHDGAAVLAPGGTLGGTQAGLRILYRLNDDSGRPLALSARLYTPRRAAGTEGALGLDWQPSPSLPAHLLVERRQAIGNEGRSAFSLTLYGGRSFVLPQGLRLDAYGQAGMVGLRRRDLFVDGEARLSRPIGPVEVGGGAWGAAQPGAERLDVGPQLSVRLPVDRATLRLSADWRFRIAGDAAPDSGPTLTLSAGF